MGSRADQHYKSIYYGGLYLLCYHTYLRQRRSIRKYALVNISYRYAVRKFFWKVLWVLSKRCLFFTIKPLCKHTYEPHSSTVYKQNWIGSFIFVDEGHNITMSHIILMTLLSAKIPAIRKKANLRPYRYKIIEVNVLQNLLCQKQGGASMAWL